MRALLLIADIGGYTSFMKLHRMSLAHAQENTNRLLQALVDAAPRLELVDIEGDAAFLSVAEPKDEEVAGALAGVAAAMHRGFHQRRQHMVQLSLCRCDACGQLSGLTVKFVAHLGEVVQQKVAKRTTLAGLDVILVHRMLKNSVPIREYVLMTEPVLERASPQVRELAQPIEEELEGIGTESLHFVDLASIAEEVPPPPRPSMAQRLTASLGLSLRTMPQMLRARP